MAAAAAVAAGASAAGSAAAAKKQQHAANTADARLARQMFRAEGLQDQAVKFQTPELERFRRMLDLMETEATDTVHRYEGSGFGNVMRLLNPAVGGAPGFDGPVGRGTTIAATAAQQAAKGQDLTRIAGLSQRQGAILGSEALGYGRLAAGITEDRASTDLYKGAVQAQGATDMANTLGSAPLQMIQAYFMGRGLAGGGAGVPGLPTAGATRGPSAGFVMMNGRPYSNFGINPATTPPANLKVV